MIYVNPAKNPWRITLLKWTNFILTKLKALIIESWKTNIIIFPHLLIISIIMNIYIFLSCFYINVPLHLATNRNRLKKTGSQVHNVAPALRLVFHTVVGEYINIIKTTFFIRFDGSQAFSNYKFTSNQRVSMLFNRLRWTKFK